MRGWRAARLQFEIIDCPGYGDSVDATGWIDNMIDYVQNRFKAHYDASPLGASAPSGLQRYGLVHLPPGPPRAEQPAGLVTPV